MMTAFHFMGTVYMPLVRLDRSTPARTGAKCLPTRHLCMLVLLWTGGLMLGVVVPSLAVAQDVQRDRQATQLMEKVGAPSQLAIDTFKKAGMLDVKPHALTDEERRKIKAALAALPPLNRRVLVDRLDHLAFIDGI